LNDRATDFIRRSFYPVLTGSGTGVQRKTG